ncbi:MAG: TonB family protein [Paludibacteraceae bacterium]|nr:TonB family protein [Paludibacteraceae bacterium]
MKNLILQLLFFFVIESCAFAQDTIYYNSNKEDVKSISLADHYTVTSVDKKDSTVIYEKTFDVASGHLLEEEQFYSFRKKTFRNGVARIWFKSGQLQREAIYKLGKLDGLEKAYWETGKLRREATYKSGELVSGKCYTVEGVDTTFYPHEVQPSFVGGMSALHEFLLNNVVYPKEAKKIDREGKTICQFFVEKDGTVDDAKIKKSSGSQFLDDEAVRVV